jgi:glycine/D-amino acid oxidase-like deaminating enzyme
MNARPRISVIGGGIIGAAIAYALSGKRADVDLFDARRPAGGTSRTSFAWINAQSTRDRAYFDLRTEALRAYRELPDALQRAMGLRWTGSLTFNDSPEALEHALGRLQSWGHPVRGVDTQEFRALEPALHNPPLLALHSESDGTVEPRRATFALLSAARERGARLHFNAKIPVLLERNGRIESVRIAGSEVACDAVVLATGADTNELLSTVGGHLPIVSETDTLLYLQAAPGIFARVLNAPTYHFRQRLDGQVVLGSDVAEERGQPPSIVAAQLIRRFAADFDSGVAALAYTTRPSRRVVPADGMPVVGHVPTVSNLYVAVTHSGITLAPLIAQIAAEEILDTGASRLASQFRPDRFQPTRR